MEIVQITENKRDYIDILLLADEQESLIDLYLSRGELFVLKDPEVRAACVVTRENEDVLELQNLAVLPEYQRQGYGKALVTWLYNHYAGQAKRMTVGTGDSPLTVPFYEACGFVYSHRLKDYMLQVYDRPIFENGVQLFDKVYFTREL